MDAEFVNVTWVTACVVAATGTAITLLVLLCKASQWCRARGRHREKVKRQALTKAVESAEAAAAAAPAAAASSTAQQQSQHRQQQKQQQKQQHRNPPPPPQVIAPRDENEGERDEDETGGSRRSVTCCNCFTITTGYDETTGGSRTSVYTFDDFLQRSFSHSQQETTQSGSSASAQPTASATSGREGESQKSSMKHTQSLGRSSSKGSRRRSGLTRRRSLQSGGQEPAKAKAKEATPIGSAVSVSKAAAAAEQQQQQQQPSAAGGADSTAIDMSDSDCDDCGRDDGRPASRQPINPDFLTVADRRQPGLLEKYEMEWPPLPSNRQSPRSSRGHLEGVQARAAPGRRGHIIFGRGNSSLFSTGQL